jgi:hypothetical protein
VTNGALVRREDLNIHELVRSLPMILLWLGVRNLLFREVRGQVETMVKGGEFDRLLLKSYPAMGTISSFELLNQRLELLNGCFGGTN